MAPIYLGLGSNLGNRREQLRQALAALCRRGVRLQAASSLYETAPMYELDQPPFLNAAIRADTTLTPEELLAAVKAVEHELGRQPRARFGPREIDLDVLLFEGQWRTSEELTIPHPRMAERPFVQAPLAELRGQPAATYPGVRLVEGPGWAEGI